MALGKKNCNNFFEDTLKLSKILLNEKHDLMHKAVGWMLREVGKRDCNLLKKFIKENYTLMPRTTLRYAIEKFDNEQRQKILKGKINDL
jgi:3-methyladenine DNA glycosylase AlkD